MAKMNKEYLLAIIILSFVTVLTSWDLVEDYSKGSDITHLVIEIIVILASIVAITLFIKRLFFERAELTRDLNQSREDLLFWKQKSKIFMEGLVQEMDQQFENWKLTKSEKEIALMLIKGLSSKEIAEIRGTAEKTVRVHTTSIFRKAQVSNRNELTAFFLEDLLLPQT